MPLSNIQTCFKYLLNHLSDKLFLNTQNIQNGYVYRQWRWSHRGHKPPTFICNNYSNRAVNHSINAAKLDFSFNRKWLLSLHRKKLLLPWTDLDIYTYNFILIIYSEIRLQHLMFVVSSTQLHSIIGFWRKSPALHLQYL